MRTDRTISVLLAPVTRALKGEDAIPILMYHAIDKITVQSKHPYFGTVTSPEIFGLHLQLLKEQGYQTLTLGQLEQAWSQKRKIVKKSVVITFDDGFADFYENAIPLLKTYDFSATMFLPTAYIDKIQKGIDNRLHLSWDQIRNCADYGIEFGSHTVNHIRPDTLSSDLLEQELSESRRIIEKNLGLPVVSFSSPYKFPDHKKQFVKSFPDALKKAGFRIGVSTRIGLSGVNDHRMYLKRLPINEFDDPKFFNAKLDGGYNWLFPFQYLSKYAKNILKNTPARQPSKQ